jgi:hypothetical protein
MKVIVYENRGEAENKINADIPELRFRVSDLELMLSKYVKGRARYGEWISIELFGNGEIWYLPSYWELIAENLEENKNKN